MKERVKYDFALLDQYCNENNVVLFEDYSSVKINRDTIINGKCSYENCNSYFHKNFRDFINAGGYCTICIQIVRNHKRRQNNLCKFGNEEPKKIYDLQKLNEIAIKNNITLLKSYDESINSKSTIEGTCIYKCGNTFKRTLKDIIKNNNLCCQKCKYLKAITEREKTNLQKYGVKIISQNKGIQEKIKNNCMIKYGVKHTGQLESVKEKFKQTCLCKYGVKNPTQNAEIAEKATTNGYKTKTYKLPSGKILKCQGYEPFALRDLIKSNINEDDIVNKKNMIPEIWFTDDNNEEHRYYVDIYVPSQNKCIEVKSIYTYKKYEYTNLLKKDAAEKMGYNFEFWIYDTKGNRICYD
jgi:hypothetical protein